MPMRQLRSCEFCGSDAAGVYEVLPPELSPTEAEQRRIVLCSSCAGTLETVVDPLLERLGVETGGGASADDAGDGPGERSGATEVPMADESGNDSDSDGPDRSPTDGPVSDDPAPDDADEGPVQWGDAGPAGDTGSGDPDHSPSDPRHNEFPERDSSDGSESMAPNADGTSPGDAAGGTSAAEGDDPAPGDEPEEFRTVMRLLGNREFPVERDAIVELAASAYELDDQHVHRIIDHAVDRGVIADDGGTLRRN